MSDAAPRAKYARRSIFAAIGLSALFAIPIVCCLGVVLFLFSSCSFNKPFVAADLPNPDRAFQTGTVAGYNVYVWECYQNKHIVVYNATAEFYSGPFKREESMCGTLTPIEVNSAEQKMHPIDPRNFW